ncbi:retropepsin-like aspartic protease family protein [Maricaulis sp.]|uniref:retropepsin-like aspartic protease family protein n=1 Tax=Maricaulis sp. TaxID=1486257 RepID=UPI003A90B6C4
MRIGYCIAAFVLIGACAAQAQTPASYDAQIESGDMPALAQALNRDDAPAAGRDWAGAMGRLALSSDYGDIDTVTTWLAQADSLSPTRLRQTFAALAERAFLETRYRDAANALEHVLALTDDETRRAEVARDQALYRIASPVPPVSVSGALGASVPITRDMANQMRVDVGLAGTATVPMLVDTGAEISVIMDRHARAAGLRFLDGEVQVGTVTEDVTGRLAVAERVELAGVLIENLVFLVLPDDDLTFADGAYTADGILGLQAYAAVGHMAWSEGGTRLSFGTAAAPLEATDPRLYWHSDGLGLEVWHGERAAGAFFDSGASRTIFRPGLLPLLDASERARLLASERTRGGLGGEEIIAINQLDTLSLGIGGVELTYNELTIDPPEEDLPPGDIAAIGNDLIARADQVTLDFEAMRYRVVLP